MQKLHLYRQKNYKGYIASYRFTNERGELMQPSSKRFSQKDYQTKPLAEEAAKIWVKEKQKRYDNNMRMLNEVPTFGYYYEHNWKPAKMSKDNATQTTVRLDTTIRQKVLHPLFNLKLTKITTGFLQHFFESKKDMKITNKHGQSHKPTKTMLKNWREAIASIFNEAIHDGYVYENPTHGLDMSRCLSKESKAQYAAKDLTRLLFTTEQYSAIFKKAEQVNPDVAPIFELMLRCGLRTQEVIGIAIEDIDLETNKLHVRRAVAHTAVNGVYVKETKTGNSRVVAFNNQAANIFKQSIQKAEGRPANITGELHSLFVRNNKNELWYTDKIAQEFSEIRDQCPGVPAYSMYTLRHTYASMMVSKRFPFSAIAQQMGHTLPVFMKYYVHALDTDINSIQKFDF